MAQDKDISTRFDAVMQALREGRVQNVPLLDLPIESLAPPRIDNTEPAFRKELSQVQASQAPGTKRALKIALSIEKHDEITPSNIDKILKIMPQIPPVDFYGVKIKDGVGAGARGAVDELERMTNEALAKERLKPTIPEGDNETHLSKLERLKATIDAFNHNRQTIGHGLFSVSEVAGVSPASPTPVRASSSPRGIL